MSRIARILILALLISLLIHLFLLGLVPKLSRPDFGKKSVILEARIVPPEKPVQFKPLVPPRPEAKRKPSPESSAGESKASSAPVAQSAPAPREKPGAGKPEVPRHAKLVFDVIRDNAIVGRAVHTWDISGDGRYTITNKVGAVGIFSLFVKGEMTQTSDGKVTDQGLRPDRYTITRGSDANRQEADFDWNDMKLALISNGAKKEIELLPMSQDQLSFLYQFAYTPPKEGVFSFHATDGRKLDVYDYQIVGEDTLLSGTLKIRAIHLKKLHQPGVEGTEIWLDEDHYYWPVQILMTDKHGDAMRQLITTIETD